MLNLDEGLDIRNETAEVLHPLEQPGQGLVCLILPKRPLGKAVLNEHRQNRRNVVS